MLDIKQESESEDEEDAGLNLTTRLKNMGIGEDDDLDLQFLTPENLPVELYFRGNSPDICKPVAAVITEEYRGQDLPLMTGEKKDQKMLLRCNREEHKAMLQGKQSGLVILAIYYCKSITELCLRMLWRCRWKGERKQHFVLHYRNQKLDISGRKIYASAITTKKQTNLTKNDVHECVPC